LSYSQAERESNIFKILLVNASRLNDFEIYDEEFGRRMPDGRKFRYYGYFFNSNSSSSFSSSSDFDNDRQGFDSFAGASRVQQPARAPSDPANNSIYPKSLPEGTSDTIIKGYNLAISIINNKDDERAIFPGGIHRREYKDTSLLIHPDKLTLVDNPHVIEVAKQAFQIILSWKERAERRERY
jgi:hypothetical protein